MVSVLLSCSRGNIEDAQSTYLDEINFQSLSIESFAFQETVDMVPKTVKAAELLHTFKISLLTFLALIPDSPPVSGYS